MIWWKVILCILFGAALGSINPSYIIGRLRGFDIRKTGSGNAGASNAMIVMGRFVGIGSALFDIGKGVVAVLVAPLIFGHMPLAGELAGAACILGHIYPFYMKFKGGKGLATIVGAVCAVDWRLFLIMLAIEILIALAADYIFVIPLSVAIVFPFLYGIFGSAGLGWLLNANAGWWGALVFAVPAVAMISRHIENIKRVRAGTEMHLSVLWKRGKKSEEIERIEKNMKK